MALVIYELLHLQHSLSGGKIPSVKMGGKKKDKCIKYTVK